MPEPILIAVPAFNAGRTLERMFQRIPRDLPPGGLEYAVVDDGSTDDTIEAAERIRSNLPALVLLRHPRNRGYGGAVKTLLSHALETGAAITVILHADGQYSPERLPEL